MPTERDLSWVTRMNDNLTAMATTSFIGGDAAAETATATATTTPTILPDFFRVPIPLREVSEHSYIPKFCPLGLYSHATTMTNSSIHIKFREDFAKLFMDNTRRNWADICSHVVGNSVEYWVKLYGDFQLGQQGEGQPADAPQCQNVDMEEMKVLLVLDTVFVVCFLQGDHQRICKAVLRGLRCPAVSSLNQEMKKEALFPLVHLIRLDLFKFENQIPLGLIRQAFEMIVFDESGSSADLFNKFLKDSVQLIYFLSRPREDDEFKGVLKTQDFRNCKHLLQCLYVVLCHESEFSKKRNLAIALENRERELAVADFELEKATKDRQSVERNRDTAGGGAERPDLVAARAEESRAKRERNAARTRRDTARGYGDTRHTIDAEAGNSDSNQDHVSHTSACGWWPRFSSCLCKRRHKEHLSALHIPTVSELQKVGIKVMVGRGKCATNWISEVNFKKHVFSFLSGTLYLPEFSVYDETEALLRNLLAYELIVEKKQDLLSYIQLMGNLINTEEDVKLMRESLVLKNNSLGSDKLLADMWNGMLRGIVVDLNEPYQKVFDQISSQYENGWNKWYAEFYGLYLRRPWLFFGAVGLVVTAIGSIMGVVFTVLGYYHRKK